MIGALIFLSGALVLIAIVYDFLRTTISFSGLGFISFRLAYGLWRAGSRLIPFVERRFGLSLRGAIGPVILTAVAANWIIIHLVGYILMFLGGQSLIKAGTGEPATLMETIAFTGSALSTLGASTVEPTNGWWDSLSMIAAVNGMVVLTLSVSFVLNILQTTISGRTFAVRYHALISQGQGRSDREVLKRVAGLGPQLCEVVVKLTSSPLPGMFVPSDRDMNFPDVIAELCDLLDNEGLGSRKQSVSEIDVAELRWGLGLLGRHFKTDAERSDFDAARDWAMEHTLPEQEAT